LSYRYDAAFIDPGLNTLVQGTPSYTYYLNSWGKNTEGQLALGNTTNRSSPVQVGALTDWLEIAGGYSFALAVKTNGTLWSWGRNNTGQLGLGNTTDYSSPKQIGALTTWAYVGVASNGTNMAGYAIKTDGTMWVWGSGANGRLGLDDTSSRSSPVQLGALTNWLKITSGAYSNFAVAIKTDGTMWSWGSNNAGQLGIGLSTAYNTSSPQQIGALTSWANVSIGFNFAMAIKTDGTLWAWGGNSQGQQGVGNTTMRSSPIQVGALTAWSKISCGFRSDGAFCQAVRTDGTLWSWGFNRNGQLGLGTSTYYATLSSPNQVGSLTNWSNVSCGNEFAMASKTDGTLWSWGANNVGQLGLANTTQYSSPKQIGGNTNWYDPSAAFNSAFALAY
jgi:alpha-tubulin suppressor-like RCC1 family protein